MGSVNDITNGEHSKFFEIMCRISDVNIGFSGRTINEDGVMTLMVTGEGVRGSGVGRYSGEKVHYRPPDPPPYFPPPRGKAAWGQDPYGGLSKIYPCLGSRKINKKFPQSSIIFFQSRGVRPRRPGRC
jgi:hypothetical protein